MRRIWIAGVAVLSAVALLLIGALQPFEPQGSVEAAATTPASAFLGPGSTGDLAERIAALEGRIEQDPEDATAHALLGLAYFAQHNATESPAWLTRSESAFETSLDLQDVDNFEAYLGLGILQASRHRFHESLKWGREAKKTRPYNADARGVIVDSLIELGRYEQGARALQSMIDLKPNLSSYARVSYYRELHGDTRGAIRFMELARDTSSASPLDTAWASAQLGDVYLSLGRLEAAQREFERAEFFDPGSWAPEVGFAEIAAARGDLEKAIRITKRAAASYPSHEYVELLASLYTTTGRHAQASLQYRRLARITASFEDNGARTTLDSAVVKADRGMTSRDLVAEAKAEYRRTPSISAADALAWTLYAAGDYERAAKFARKSLRLGTKNALYHFHAGMIAEALGDEDGARRHLATALSINPHFDVVQAITARRVLRSLR